MGANEKAAATYHPNTGPDLDPAQVEAAARYADPVWGKGTGPSYAPLRAAFVAGAEWNAALTAAAQVQPARPREAEHLARLAANDGYPQPAPEADEREWTQGAPWHFVHAPQAEEREALRAEVALHRQVGDMCTCGERTARWFGWRDHFVEVLMARRSQPAPRTVSAAQVQDARNYADRSQTIHGSIAWCEAFLGRLGGITVEGAP